MKVAKVIATCFKPRIVIENTSLVGNPLGFFSHSQNFTNSEEIIELLKLNIKLETESEPGIERDIVFVNSDVKSKEGNDFIDNISGTKIPGGKIICLTRQNVGRSFGAYNDAFLKFRDNYDYFLFTEDDIIITKKNYFKKGLDIWHNSKLPGFIAYISTTRIGWWHWKKLNLNINTAYACHGGTGLSSTKVLNEIVSKYGCLPHNTGSDYLDDITYGEVAFPNSILQLGYKLIDLPKEEILAVPAYDIMRNIEYRKFPNIFEKIIYYIKSIIYFILSKNSFSLKAFIFIKELFRRYKNN